MLGLLLFVFFPFVFAQFLGPAKVEVNQVQKCSEYLLGYKANFSMKRANRTHYVANGDFEWPFDIGSEVQVNFTASKWGDGGYKPHYYDIYDKDACLLMEKYGGEMFERGRRNMGQPNKCPLKAGTWKVRDYFLGSEFELPLPYGKFKVNWMWIKDGIEFMCLEYFITVDPKRMKPPV